MTKDRILPLEAMTEKEFETFRQKYLANPITSEAMANIRRVFALQDYNTCQVECEKEHQHSFDCVHYNFRSACVIDRLIEEIRYHRIYLNKLAGQLAKIN